jgi:hypothetical protein
LTLPAQPVDSDPLILSRGLRCLTVYETEHRWNLIQNPLSTVAVGVGLFAAFFGFRAWNSLRQPVSELEFPKQAIFDIPGSFYLRNVPALENVHLLDGDFKIVRRLEEVPDACMRTFESSFVNINGLRAKQGEVRFANPGEPFNWSDAIERDLPFRRLELARLNTSGCFIHYQKGGMFPSFCLAVIDTGGHKIRVGEYRQAAKDLRELRQMLFQHRFADGSGC